MTTNTRTDLIKALRTHAVTKSPPVSFGESLAASLADLLAACTEDILGMNVEEREAFVQRFHKEFRDWESFYPREEKSPGEPKLNYVMSREFTPTPVDDHGTSGISTAVGLRMIDSGMLRPTLKGKLILKPGEAEDDLSPCIKTKSMSEYRRLVHHAKKAKAEEALAGHMTESARRDLEAEVAKWDSGELKPTDPGWELVDPGKPPEEKK